MKTTRRIPFFLTARNIKHSNKWTLSLIILLMAIAFINLLFVNSLFNGVINSNESQLINTRTGNITVLPAKGAEFIGDPGAVVKKVEKVDGVKAATAEYFLQGALQYRGQRGNFETTAVDPVQEKAVTSVAHKMISGTYLSENDTDGIVLGESIAGKKDDDTGFAQNGIKVGDKVGLMIESGSYPLTVRGVFETKFSGTDDRAFITEAALRKIAPGTLAGANAILVKTDKRGRESETVAMMRASGVPGTLRTWQQSAGQVREITSSFVTINALLTIVGFFIAAVTIFIIIYVDVTHRRQEIGILRAIGVRSPLIITTYILQAAVYSFMGVALGTILYFAVLWPYFQAFPFKIPIGDVTLFIVPWDYLFRAFTVIFVGMLSGLIPAMIGTRRPILDDILNR